MTWMSFDMNIPKERSPRESARDLISQPVHSCFRVVCNINININIRLLSSFLHRISIASTGNTLAIKTTLKTL